MTDLPHIPVLARELLEYVPTDAPATVVDGTFGAGGHARLIAERLHPGSTYIASDRDASTQQYFDHFADQFSQLTTRFRVDVADSQFRRLIAEEVSASLVILDLGLSSMQIDQHDRGFTYADNGPLDMRMDQRHAQTAADIVNTADERELVRIFRIYGEEKHAARHAKAIVRQREDTPFTQTAELAAFIEENTPKKNRRRGHPAKRVFQALRIAVNDELGSLERCLEAMPSLLAPGGKCAIITFHSLEDRIVKRTYRKWADPCVCPPDMPMCACGLEPLVTLDNKGIGPSDAEVESNPRAASARLRVCTRVEVV